MSKLYSRSISDKEIVNVSGFLEKLQPGDAVMADKGFNIQDYLASLTKLHICHLSVHICNVSVTVMQLSAVRFP